MKKKLKILEASDRCFMIEIPEQEAIQGERTFLTVNSYTLDSIVLRESTIKSMAEIIQQKERKNRRKTSKNG
jgi:hypothetical protein